MDTDGEVQHEDDVNVSVPAEGRSENHKQDGSKEEAGDSNNNDGKESSDIKQIKEQFMTKSIHVPRQTWSQQGHSQVVKRRHVQSRRMQEYQQQLISQPLRNPRTCPICARTLYSGPGFRYHQQKHRHNNESFPCDTCHKVFKSFNGLKYHQKRKRCRGQGQSAISKDASSSIYGTATTGPPSLDVQAERLMELAKIATGPQSPLLRSPGADTRGSTTGVFFDDCETSAAMTLSSMKKKCSAAEGATSTAGIASQHIEKPKRPMNGFMLFAQRNRAELNKKYPDMNNRMISTKLSEEWKKLAEGDRKKWVEEANERAKQHQKEHPDCWKRKK